MNHEIVGSITEVPWAFNFVYGGPGVAGTYRHPAQIYESAVYLILFIFMVWYYFKYTKGKMRAGSATGILLVVIYSTFYHRVFQRGSSC
jgi:prolipoprotein diacylglyceryltransferase